MPLFSIWKINTPAGVFCKPEFTSIWKINMFSGGPNGATFFSIWKINDFRGVNPPKPVKFALRMQLIP